METLLSIIMGVVNWLTGRSRDAHDLQQRETGADKQHAADEAVVIQRQEAILQARANQLTDAELDDKLKDGSA